jgi:hypothetical protein
MNNLGRMTEGDGYSISTGRAFSEMVARDAVWETDEAEWVAGIFVLRAVIRTASRGDRRQREEYNEMLMQYESRWKEIKDEMRQTMVTVGESFSSLPGTQANFMIAFPGSASIIEGGAREVGGTDVMMIFYNSSERICLHSTIIVYIVQPSILRSQYPMTFNLYIDLVSECTSDLCAAHSLLSLLTARFSEVSSNPASSDHCSKNPSVAVCIFQTAQQPNTFAILYLTSNS